MYDPVIPLLGIYPTETKAGFCSQQHHKSQKVQATQASTQRRMDKQLKYYSALKRKDALTHATLWTTLEATELSGIAKSQKDRYHEATHMRDSDLKDEKFCRFISQQHEYS